MKTVHNTFVLTRTYPATPERVFAALSDPAKKRRWFGESDSHDIERFDMDFRVGGEEKSVYRFKPNTLFPGAAITNDSVYLDIVSNQRVVLAYNMTLGDRRISASLVTFELISTEGAATDLVLTHQGAFFEGSDGPEMREGGWRKLLEKLGASCQPEK